MIAEKMAELAQARKERFNHLIVQEFPSLMNIDSPTILGAYSWTQIYKQNRIMREIDLVDVGNGQQTPTEVTRDYLASKFAVRRRITTGQYHNFYLHRAAPLLAVPCVLEEAAYLDIRSAYWSITNIVGWDVDYHPSKFLGKGQTVEDFPLAKHKPARSSLVSIGLPSSSRMWDGKQFYTENTYNPHLNLGLWALTMDVLHAIAAQARDYGAVYIHTDGFIFPADRINQFATFVRDWGLDCRVKLSGQCEVRGVGQYKVGRFKAGRWADAPSYHSYVYDVDTNWLLPRFARFAAVSPIR